MNENAERVAYYDQLFREKVGFEIASADALVSGQPLVQSRGEVLACVLLVKGTPGPHDVAVGSVLAGSDGIAITKALNALDLSRLRYAVCSRTGTADITQRTNRLHLIVAAIDPAVVIALDKAAAQDVSAALKMSALTPGVPVRVCGRTLLAVDDFEASLGDEGKKRRVWKQLKSLAKRAG